MAGYLGKGVGVTLVDGYTKDEADDKFVEGDSTLYIDETNDRVGIGTTSPTAPLDVEISGSSGTNMIELTNASNSYALRLSGSDFLLRDGADDRIAVKADGKVGIGTTSPAEELHVHGTGQVAMLFTNEDTGTASNDGLFVGINTSEHGYLWHYENKDVVIGTNNATRLTVNSNGNVGVGTTASGNARMQINSNTTMPLLVHRESNTAFDPHGIGFSTRNDAADGGTSDVRSGIFSKYSGNIFLAANTSSITSDPLASSRLYVENNGDVGIGTTSPGFKLDVVGNIRLKHTGTNNYAAIQGPENRSLYIDLDANGDTDAFAVRDGRDDSKRFVVEAGGDVGIGTDTPASPLHVQADGIGIRLDGTANTSRKIFFRSTTTSNPAEIYADGTLKLWTEDSGTDIMLDPNDKVIAGGVVPTADTGEILSAEGPVGLGSGRYTGAGSMNRRVLNWYTTDRLNSASGSFYYLKTNLWGGGAANGNSQYIMGGFEIRGYRYATTCNCYAYVQFHNWNGSMYNKSTSNMGNWSPTIDAYISSDGYVTLKLGVDNAYCQYQIDTIQHDLYTIRSWEVTAAGYTAY